SSFSLSAVFGMTSLSRSLATESGAGASGSIFPTHVYVVRKQPEEPAAAAHPAAPSIAIGIFDDHVIDRLPLRRGPEKRPREKAAVFLADDAKSVFDGPLLQQRVGPLESPNPGENDKTGEGQDPHNDKEIFHLRFRANGERRATGAIRAVYAGDKKRITM